MRILDLFSGIGGFSIAADWLGWETVAFCEQDKFCQKVLKKHWPDVPIFDDIKTLKGDEINGPIDIICGGFPCQPWSTAGKRRGADDDRHLWPEMLRVVQETRPRWVIGENVAGIIRMGLDAVLADLEAEGYACQSFVIPACGIGAQHRRDRVWIVANRIGPCGRDDQRGGDRNKGQYSLRQENRKESAAPYSGQDKTFADSKTIRRQKSGLSKRKNEKVTNVGIIFENDSNTQSIGSQSDTEPDWQQSGSGQESIAQHAGIHGDQFSPNTDSAGYEKQFIPAESGDMGEGRVWQFMPDPKGERGAGQAEPRVCRGLDGVSEGLDPVIKSCWSVPAWVEKAETGPNYKNRIKALGNSIVPQVVYQIFKAIQQVENDTLRNIR